MPISPGYLISSSSLPTQTGNAGKVLTTNGVVATWAVGPSSGDTPLPNVLKKRYVRSTGNDTTGDGLTSGTAFLTIERALEEGWSVGETLQVELTGYGTYTPAAQITLPGLVTGPTYTDMYYHGGGPEQNALGLWYRGDLEFYAEPTVDLTISGGTYTQAQDSVTSCFTITKAAAGWTVNQFQNKMVLLPNWYILGRVVSNTSDTLVTTIASYPGAVLTGPVKIMTESCTIDLTATSGLIAGQTTSRRVPYAVAFGGIKITNGDLFYSSWVDLVSLVGFSGSIGLASGRYLKSDGLCATYGTVQTNFTDAAYFNYTKLKDVTQISNDDGKLAIYGFNFDGCHSVGDGYYHGVQAESSLGVTSIAAGLVQNAPQAGLRIVNITATASVGFVRFTNCSLAGILLQQNAKARINGPVAGTGNGVGVSVQTGSKLLIHHISESAGPAIDQTTLTVTGTAGDLLVGQNAARTWTDFFTSATGAKVELDTLRSGSEVRFTSTAGASALKVHNTADTFVTTLATAASAARTITFPDATDTVAVLGTAQTFSAVKTFGVNAAFTTIAAPAAPTVGTSLLYSVDGNGIDRLAILNSDGVTTVIGQDEFTVVRNTSGAPITKGQVVYVTGSTGSVPNVSLARANSITTTVPLGMVLSASIADNAYGRVQTSGTFENVNTNAYTPGTVLYLSDATPGALTSTDPAYPNFSTHIATVLNQGIGNGSLQVVCSPTFAGHDTGTIKNTWAIGNQAAGAKTITFNNANVGTLSWNPTASRTLTLPDVTDTVAVLGTAQTFTKSQNVARVALTDAATIATDASLGNVFSVTLADNRTLGNPTNLVDGGTYIWLITQDGTGGRTLAYGANFAWPGGTAPVLTTAIGAVDMISAVYDGTKLRSVATLDIK